MHTDDDLSLKVAEQLMNTRYITHSTTPLFLTECLPPHNRLQFEQPFNLLRTDSAQDHLVWSNIKKLSKEEEKQPWWILSTKNEDGLYSVSGLLFIFGFVFPPLWWLGSFWPRHAGERGGKMAERWQQMNRIMSIGFSAIIIILVIVFAVLYSVQ